MKYWDIESTIDNVSIGVTNINNLRELKVDVKENPASLSDVIVKQTDLAIAKNKEYTLSFDAYGEEDKTIKAQINGESFEANITTEKTNFKYKFKTGEVLNNSNLELLLGASGVTYIDNVRIEETGLITNGDFGNGFAKWELFADSSVSSKVSSSIDNSTGDPSGRIDIQDTGDADWKIQLKQSNVKLEKGKKYVLSLDAKSTIDRSIMFTIQRDGSSDNDWRPYSPNEIVELKGEYNKYQVIFEMTEESDENSIFSIAMGAVNGTQITDEHSINIDNVKLEEYIPLVTENLFNTIKNAKVIVYSDEFDEIVEEDREKLIAALNEAEEVYENAVSENPTVTQEIIDNAEQNLKNIMDNLRKEEQKEPGQDDNNQDENNKPGNNKPGDNKPGNNKPGVGNKNESINKNNKPLVNTGSEAYIIILVSALVMVAVGVKIIKRKKSIN